METGITSRSQRSRTEMAARNVAWGYANTIVTTILKFICRWAFIKTIGVDYLGINGLITSVLGVLSLTELGIGTAMNYSLYKPVAEKDYRNIRTLMVFYKRAYRLVALVIAVLGTSLIPLLPTLVRGGEGIDHLRLYYVLFLFNTVSTYFVSYKYSLAGADQRYYVINNIDSVTAIVMNVLQIAVLFVFRSFLVYLIVQIACLLISKVCTSVYLDHMYPYLKEGEADVLDEETKRTLFGNVRALIIHKLGDVAVNQTDSIIISSAISITATGLISNYTLVINTVCVFLGVIFGSFTGSLGNLIATTSKEKQLQIFKVYDFISFWLFGFCAIAFTSLIQPFTVLMWGGEYEVEYPVVLLIIINSYIVGQRVPLSNMKTAAGVFKEDKWLPAIQAATNLIVSIALAHSVGLIGVYIGTLVSGIVPSFIRPILVYRKMFDCSAVEYFRSYSLHMLVVIVLGLCTALACAPVLASISWPSFFGALAITIVIPNACLVLIYRDSPEFSYIVKTARVLLGKMHRA